MAATIIDGKARAARMRAALKSELAQSGGLTPGLAVVIVGDNPASHVYVRSKIKMCEECGIASLLHPLPATVAQSDLLALIDRLNTDPEVHGILVQLPLPDHLAANAILARLNPAKDVDGFHPINVGALSTGQPGLAPCTPMGCMVLLLDHVTDLTGMDAVILGRSNIVGKPMAQLLLRHNCTVTIAHSRTRNLAEKCAQADILVAAVGRPEMVRGTWVKPGATVIDVGINRVDAPEKGPGKTRLVGDVAFDEVVGHAGAITPVPGGVGPMTIACLLQNTVTAAKRQASSAP